MEYYFRKLMFIIGNPYDVESKIWNEGNNKSKEHFYDYE
jgi:hypothetical protein